MKMNLLDIGGGFLGEKENLPLIREHAKIISAFIQEIFSDFPHTEVIAEPGRTVLICLIDL